jgi:hypothetical protein
VSPAKKHGRPRCITCACTEARACLVSYGGQTRGCAWILVDRANGEGLCSACASPEQLVYGCLRDSGGGLSVSQLAEYTGCASTRIRRALRRLESKGLAERKIYGSVRPVPTWQLVAGGAL